MTSTETSTQTSTETSTEISTQTSTDDASLEVELAVSSTVEQLIGQLASAGFVAMVAIGDRLGLYAALDRIGASTAAALAAETGCNERLLFEWLCSNAAAGYLTRDATDDTFALSPGVAPVLADPTSPAYLAPAATVIRTYYTDQEQLEAAFRGSGGIAWGDHHECMFGGVERFFATAYSANLVPAWIPAVAGLDERLRRGARVADVGCGHGVSTAVLAAAYPASEFRGFDFHEPSIERAETVAAAAGVAGNTAYGVARSTDYDGGPYDVICFFDALHDMGDPEAAIRHARSQLADDGIVLLVEVFAGDDLTTTLEHPLAQWFFAASTVLCTPCALSQGGPLALGNQAGPARLGELFRANGFRDFEVALETPFNLVMAARP